MYIQRDSRTATPQRGRGVTNMMIMMIIITGRLLSTIKGIRKLTIYIRRSKAMEKQGRNTEDTTTAGERNREWAHMERGRELSTLRSIIITTHPDNQPRRHIPED